MSEGPASLDDLWQQYREQVLPAEATVAEVRSQELAFYAGMLAMAGQSVGAANVSRKTLLQANEKWQREFAQFGRGAVIRF